PAANNGGPSRPSSPSCGADTCTEIKSDSQTPGKTLGWHYTPKSYLSDSQLLDSIRPARQINSPIPAQTAQVGLVVAAVLFATSTPSFATEVVPLAIKGYDPVAYFTIGRPTRGLPEIEYEWDEQSYRFASAEDRELFKADPVRYAPQFGNFCAMALAEGELTEANPENWLISDGKLYIFGKPAPMGPALFQQDLAANIAKANKNRALIQGQ